MVLEMLLLGVSTIGIIQGVTLSFRLLPNPCVTTLIILPTHTCMHPFTYYYNDNVLQVRYGVRNVITILA